MRRPLAAIAAVALLASVAVGCGGKSAGDDVLVVVSAPVQTAPWIATFERRGAELAADELNADGGVEYAGHRHHVAVDVIDNGGSPQRAVAAARTAVDRGAAMLVIDGVGAAAVAEVTDPAHLPVFVVFDGGASFIDPAARPTLFRLAPADEPMSMRLADYLAAQRPRPAVLNDDSGFGRDGARALDAAFVRDKAPVAFRATVPTGAADVRAQVLGARRAHATTLVVWASAPIVAAAIEAARSAGWGVPIWAGPTGEDPLVRQRLASHPEWLDRVGFVSFRITAEVGPKPFATYRAAYEKKFGPDRLELQQDGHDVVQPPDWSMFPYDAVKLVAAGLEKSGAIGEPLLRTLEGGVVITGANGDERGYLESTREGVSQDDMYFAVFDGFVFRPVTDDLLSQNLPAVPQTVS